MSRIETRARLSTNRDNPPTVTKTPLPARWQTAVESSASLDEQAALERFGFGDGKDPQRACVLDRRFLRGGPWSRVCLVHHHGGSGISTARRRSLLLLSLDRRRLPERTLGAQKAKPAELAGSHHYHVILNRDHIKAASSTPFPSRHRSFDQSAAPGGKSVARVRSGKGH